ncbi:hypothetical protein GBA52_010530 [Prunus armeniaca]|nr:hypothetical protein GBA52_010530 [Prunus armeniaca]
MDFLTQVVEGTVEGIKKSKGHSMKLRSGRRSANAADFEHFDVDYGKTEDSYFVNPNFSGDDHDVLFKNGWMSMMNGQGLKDVE